MWWTGAALGLDFETDGPEPTEARIITGATVLMTPGNRPQPIETMLQPERDIPQGAIDVHGITTERARDEGIDRATGVRLIAETIADLAGPEIPVVGHNLPYDLTLLDREMRRTGVGQLRSAPGGSGWVRVSIDGNDVGEFPVIDTLVLDKAVDRYRKGSRKIEAVARHYGVPMAEGSAHGATADVIAGLRIAIAIANRGHHADLSLAELHLAQVRWAAEQAAGLRDYFIRTGKTEEAETVSGQWPLRRPAVDSSVEDISTTLI